jgi:HSP20 family protein
MKPFIRKERSDLIYPGAYVPLLNEAELKKEVKQSFKIQSELPAARVTELTDSYIVELSIPGLCREDFLIHADENILSVCVCHKSCDQQNKADLNRQSFNYGLFDQHIVLPLNAETAFLSAEYSKGILSFHIPKNNKPVKSLHTKIAVY